MTMMVEALEKRLEQAESEAKRARRRAVRLEQQAIRADRTRDAAVSLLGLALCSLESLSRSVEAWRRRAGRPWGTMGQAVEDEVAARLSWYLREAAQTAAKIRALYGDNGGAN